ncbi:MAG: hypothetical protein QF453_04675 [Candidatus Marinimicrobia bacterium]|jgi:cytochrome c oxidase subunit 2|nr:hypothetical protein [Candidatus Neomarinimicrobiota bacterium]
MIELLGKLSSYLGFPVMSSRHGQDIDYMNGWVHWLMLVLFVGWGIFFIFVLIRFRSGANPKASYQGATSHISQYTEYGVIIFEAFLLIGFAYPLWAKMKTDVPTPDKDTVEVRVVAQQFAWNMHYPGADGIFGKTSPELIDEEINPIGLDRSSPNGADDITTINQLHLPVDKLTMIYLTSKDVIHSFSLPEMRVKQDVIPGMSIPTFFTPTMTTEAFLEVIKGTAREGMGYEISCAQLCGNSHYRMRGFMTVHEPEKYEEWLADQAEELEEEGDEWGDDDW